METSSSYSTVSSLIGSNRSGTNRSRVTRNSAAETVESDSDEGLDLDESDNAYVHLPMGMLPDDLEREEEEEENTEDMQQPMTESGARLAELQWKFTPVATTNGNAFDTPVLSTEETQRRNCRPICGPIWSHKGVGRILLSICGKAYTEFERLL